MPFIGALNERYFNGRLSADVMALLAPIDDQRSEVHAFVERMFRQMRRQKIDATDFSEGLAWVIGYFLPHILPGAWGGAVPPITQKGRHAAIDEYLERNPWRPIAEGDRLLDLGCGFPPVTTMDTAERFPRVQIVGADPSFGKYLLREANGDYAVFGQEGDLIYFQAGATDIDRWEALYNDTKATHRHFSDLLTGLRELLPEDAPDMTSVSRDGVELVRNPVAEFERENAEFKQLGFGAEGLNGFSAVRCFNVLFYFDEAFRRDAMSWLADVLIDGGISVSGVNWSRSRYARYTVHRAESRTMVAREFAFSIENLRPLELVGVFALHDDDHDMNLMSSLIGTLRADAQFRADIDRRMDELQAEIEFCARKPDGYLGSIPPGADSTILNTAADQIGSALEREGFCERAVDILGKSGYRAWINCVGHVAIDPLTLPS
jgi:hypothetical protein